MKTQDTVGVNDGMRATQTPNGRSGLSAIRGGRTGTSVTQGQVEARVAWYESHEACDWEQQFRPVALWSKRACIMWCSSRHRAKGRHASKVARCQDLMGGGRRRGKK